ncbi:MAG TPA: HAD family hydrolase [Candidatus Limnocylindria bacterium]|nr:HAD family hydrolase [Candidatus Limnocylindria bacterium]
MSSARSYERPTSPPYFAIIVISAELGAGNPERLAFETVLDRLGVRSEDAVMVGDSLQRDVASARGAGLRSIWLNRGSLVAPEGMRADAEVRALSELPPLLS